MSGPRLRFVEHVTDEDGEAFDVFDTTVELLGQPFGVVFYCAPYCEPPAWQVCICGVRLLCVGHDVPLIDDEAPAWLITLLEDHLAAWPEVVAEGQKAVLANLKPPEPQPHTRGPFNRGQRSGGRAN